MTTFTVAYLRTSVLALCYDDERLQALLDRVPTEGVVAVLLSLPPHDARRVCAGLMPRPALIEWSAYAARRAKEYAAAAAAAADDAYINAYTAAAAAAAHAAAARAAYADARRKDHELSVRDACRLLGCT